MWRRREDAPRSGRGTRGKKLLWGKESEKKEKGIARKIIIIHIYKHFSFFFFFAHTNAPAMCECGVTTLAITLCSTRTCVNDPTL